MVIFRKAKQLSAFITDKKASGAFIGFAPTMGALHYGHLSLIEASKKDDQLVVCSIFVNPNQFNNKEDLDNYPVTIEKDIELLIKSGCDILFLPSKEEVYPPSYKAIHYDLGVLEEVLEGAHRPGHFQGVCQVVDRLLEIVQPEHLYLGQKDYQQCLVIKKLLQITNRHVVTHIIDTQRESTGLAMSSRNLRLSSEHKKKAAIIYNVLEDIKKNLESSGIISIIHDSKKRLLEAGFVVDYISIADAVTLQPSNDTSRKLVALIAASINGIRLIDNAMVNEPAQTAIH